MKLLERRVQESHEHREFNMKCYWAPFVLIGDPN
jgi:hypothetical protein